LTGVAAIKLFASSPALASLLPVAVALALAPAPDTRAATISFDAERSAGVLEIRASAVLKADPSTAWCALTDYSRYTEFIPDLRTSRVLSRRGATVTVEETGDATLGLLRMPLDVTFEITEHAPDSMSSRAVAGSLRALDSRYALTPTFDGVRLDYNGRVDPGFDLLAPIEYVAAERNIQRQFQALADEIERRAAEPARASAILARTEPAEASDCRGRSAPISSAPSRVAPDGR
jgi:ribosome-associated toxin RatA of RatAB toxin-antitoxin module